jgi:hypothetical protein
LIRASVDQYFAGVQLREERQSAEERELSEQALMLEMEIFKMRRGRSS